MKKGRGGRAGALTPGRVVVMRKPRGDYIPIPIGSHPRVFGTCWRFRTPGGGFGWGISTRDLHDRYGVIHFVKGSHRG